MSSLHRSKLRNSVLKQTNFISLSHIRCSSPCTSSLAGRPPPRLRRESRRRRKPESDGDGNPRSGIRLSHEKGRAERRINRTKSLFSTNSASKSYNTLTSQHCGRGSLPGGFGGQLSVRLEERRRCAGGGSRGDGRVSVRGVHAVVSQVLVVSYRHDGRGREREEEAVGLVPCLWFQIENGHVAICLNQFISSLGLQFISVKLPDCSGIVDGQNWKDYFGPFALRVFTKDHTEEIVCGH
ncbi:hypothetical protein BC936DRAFT_149408 [Jimgerdemannia flammicorona]|uniref:Uncharacterized protein n=1 Tax=Jimgerdemannia flammicorona TaxID=994334 RepID=A0A433D0X6_9FUNG|nr:hypothetical protein BC936DRAFT_149408 [Jimgerdemannia flammicorona]